MNEEEIIINGLNSETMASDEWSLHLLICVGLSF